SGGLYRTDGTSTDFVAGMIRAGAVGIAGDRMYLLDDDMALWVTDGTGPGTLNLATVERVAGATAVYRDQLYFVAKDAVHCTGLSRADGTVQRTVVEADRIPGPESSAINGLYATPDALYFDATQVSNTSAPWVMRN